MLNALMKTLFGSRNERILKRMRKVVTRINALEEGLTKLTDAELQGKTAEFRARLGNGEKLDDLLPEAFAVVREAGKRVLGMRHFDVQLIGGMVLHEGRIAEMRTGEGKTLVATLPTYLNALEGKGSHVVTVNDYLARRDAEWMGRLYNFLGLTVGVVVPGQNAEQKRAGYAADITYGTNNEFGFDYLRDNMAFRKADKVQRDLNYALVDEVDSILIDEARTPLIISGPAEDSSELYRKLNAVPSRLQRQKEEEGEGDFWVDEKTRQIHISEAGHLRVEDLLIEMGLISEGASLYDPANIVLMHHLHAALRAHFCFQRDVHYIVNNRQVVIVDEFTGRTMPGRRWSDGLHQAVEAKEGVPIQNENQTLASITFQNLFRLYKKLSGMTGTADTEAYEFQQIYGLECVVIPTHRPMVRNDTGDQVYLTAEEKYDAIILDIKDCHQKGRPVLVGTTSIETSEYLAGLLQKQNIPHEVLNAKQHEREAHIVAQAGLPGAVTIATNMAGRGTDIVLGGGLQAELKALGEDASADAIEKVKTEWQQRHENVLASGGLHIIGTERHESRRIDNQLRGRSGRQGDPGSSRFYLSLEDSLMRIFASDRVKGLMQKFGMQKGEAIEHPWVTKAIENAQRKVEAHNFDIRKHLLEFDDVANDQRKVIYEQRNELMASDDVSATIHAIRGDVVNAVITQYVTPGSFEEQWDLPKLEEAITAEFGITLPIREWIEGAQEFSEETLRKRVFEAVEAAYQAKEQEAGAEVLRHFEKAVMLQVLDTQWKDHLAAMDYLRQGINLRSYAQKNPKQEYKREAFEMFTRLLERIKYDVITILSKVQVRKQEDVEEMERQREEREAALREKATYAHAEASGLESDAEAESDAENSSAASAQPVVRSGAKVGRNDPCPCGSGKKYKQCHGQLV